MILWGLLLLLLLPLLTSAQAPAAFTLPSQPEYNLLSSCGKTCLFGSSDVWIGGRLGCSNPYTNDCMCRVDKAPTISSYASECNKNLCTLGGDSRQDISTFLSIYNSYCAKNGYTLPGAAEVTGDGGGGGGDVVGDPTAATVTRVSHATVTAASGGGRTGTGLVTAQKTVDTTIWTTVKPTAAAAEGGSGGELSRSDKIALGVGIGIGLPSAIAGIWVCFAGIWRR
ncbi:hypothetical protein B0H67DRAFT_550295 [Lasiosphaeris hirsuta]|uniref:Extracellular membrane protein CFEM domain-containing protein n=1 Tax=Lasiosphaeris hirsuta TaxID=260670 RepID=A0AA40AYW7_9PEZI|nr:hypothetical protein B0H67DRAFT_550295 [Lasiosphaeris hirsuta]